MKTVQIRRIREEDIDSVCGVIHRTLRISNTPDYGQEEVERLVRVYSREGLREKSAASRMYVLTQDGAVRGCGAVSDPVAPDGSVSLTAVFVDPDFQDLGFGRRILEALEKDARSRQARRIELSASLTAVGFYGALGYVFLTGIPDHDRLITMEKRLDPAR